MATDKIVEIQRDIKNKAEDFKDFLSDLKSWETDIKKKDATVSKKHRIEADYPPVRGTVDEKELQKMLSKKEADNPIKKQKDLGNECFKQQKYDEAIAHYTKAIKYDEDDKDVHILYSNRSMANIKLENWTEAENDASNCINHNRTFTKGFFRRALARKNSGKLSDALSDLNTVLVLEPTNKEAAMMIKQLEAELAKLEKQKQPSVARKTLQIEEVDDDEESEEEEEIEIPIKKKEPSPKAAPPVATPPVEKKEKVKKEAKPLAHSGVEVLSDSDEEEVVINKKHVDPMAIPEPTPTPPPTPVETKTSKESSPTNRNSSPKGGKHIVPREAALKAAEEYQRSGKMLEVPKNYLQFQRVWSDLKQDEQPTYLRSVPTDKYVDFFKSNISEDVLADIITISHDVFVKSSDTSDHDRAFAIVKQLSQLDRLSALLLFIDSAVSSKLEALPGLLSAHDGISVVAANLKTRLDS